ncbi:MAG TPA: ABC transporter permease [Gemmatimonadales bacterium]|nr:ABC transporter permease [Gemmatimonadales bacterium]
MGGSTLREGVLIALDQLRNNKLRSVLTILGVVIGVTVVMAMASIVQGVRSQIFNAIEVAGPSTFYVMRFFSQTPVNPDNLPPEIRIRPVLDRRDAAAVARAETIAYAGLWIQLFSRVTRGAEHTQTVTLFAADDHFMDIQGGTLLRGRMFSPAELHGAPVIILEADVASRLFGQEDPLGKYVRAGDQELQVIGIYQKPGNIFEPPGQATAGVIPFETGYQRYRFDQTNALFIAVRPRAGVDPARARDEAIVALRRVRGLRPAAPNTFDLITQDQILATVGSLTGVFFLVMVALSSVALLVGGIGVMAIMMVSVTDRTREIGTRKALGATRRMVLWQFLVEAATLTLAGGIIGIAFGLLTGEVLKRVLAIEASVPVWSALLACGVSVLIGLVFGVIPANRAAKMDPVEALRHE